MPHADPLVRKEYHRKRNIRARFLRRGIPTEGWQEKECYSCGKTFKPRTRVQINCSQVCYQTSKNKLEYHRNYTKLKSSNDPKYFLRRSLIAYERYKTLTIDNLVDLWNTQKGLCALSGRPLTHIYGQGRQYTNVSIDRIDCSKGYELDNIRLVCSIVNMMRNTMSDKELFDWCKTLLKHNKELL